MILLVATVQKLQVIRYILFFLIYHFFIFFLIIWVQIVVLNLIPTAEQLHCVMNLIPIPEQHTSHFFTHYLFSEQNSSLN